MEPQNTEIPRHSVINSDLSPSLSSVSVMCRGKRFEITVSIEDLYGGAFEKEYRNLIQKFKENEDSDEDYEQLCDWILEPCFRQFRELAPLSNKLTFSLQDYYHPPVYFLQVHDDNGFLSSKRILCTENTFSNALLVPACSLPGFPEIARLKASEVQIVPDPKNDDHLCEIPQKVQIQDGSVKYFKPPCEKSQFIREASTFVSIAKAKLPENIRIPRLCGIVISDDAQMVLGLLVDWIPSIGNLQSEQAKKRHTELAKWERQIQETVQVLHDHDIVWGDVHPGNIVIDTNLDAWVIDFGGGWVEPFVDRKIAGTRAGDWQGVQRVFDQLNQAASS